MWEDYNGTGNEIIRPNVHTYNTVMVDFAQLGHAIKFKQLLIEVLDHEGSKDTSLSPDRIQGQSMKQEFCMTILD